MAAPSSCGRLAPHVRRLADLPLCELVSLFQPRVALRPLPEGVFRNRLFTLERTFWLFLSQVLSADRSCREAVRKALAWLAILDPRKASSASPSTAGFCQARKRLPDPWLRGINRQIGEDLENVTPTEWKWHGRNVKVIDGSSVQLPDTPDNQAAYPQPHGQKPGCGFPVIRIVALFSLATGALLDLAYGTLRWSERFAFRLQMDQLRDGDLVLADRGFCGFAEFFELLERDVDAVIRKHASLGTNLHTLQNLGPHDRLVEWKRLKRPAIGYSRATWKAMPRTLIVREIRIPIEVPGFRTKTYWILTTVLDARRFPAQDFGQLYRLRWQVELNLRHLKTTLGMELLHGRTPAMAHKELMIYAIAYNLIRALLADAARTHAVPIHRMSFKGAVQTVRQWAPLLAAIPSARHRARHFRRLLCLLANDTLPDRPDRAEPRALKRRSKTYQHLTKPRGQFREISHRNKYPKRLS